jgi:hypothetical protein
MTMQPAHTGSAPPPRAVSAHSARLCAIGALIALIVVAACGGDNSSNSPSAPTTVAPAPPPPAPTPPSPRQVQQGTMSLAAPQGEDVYFALASIIDNTTGRWETTVDWTDPANELWMWVANGVCTAQQFARDDCPFEATCPCQFAVRSEVATPKPRVLTIPNAAGATRTLIVVNLGPKEETATYRVTLTPGSLAAAAAAVPTPASGVFTGKKTIRKP